MNYDTLSAFNLIQWKVPGIQLSLLYDHMIDINQNYHHQQVNKKIKLKYYWLKEKKPCLRGDWNPHLRHS